MAHDEHDTHAIEDGHHQVGPVSQTEVVPQNSMEDKLLLLLLSLAFVFLAGTTIDWWLNVKADAQHESAEGAAVHEGTSTPEQHTTESQAPATPEGTTPAVPEGTPVDPVTGLPAVTPEVAPVGSPVGTPTPTQLETPPGTPAGQVAPTGEAAPAGTPESAPVQH